jgi:NAD(P)-dependent dehydrogenase (short-subunit alcohol dehydrogenase family)
MRTVAVITGAAGSMGTAIARKLGHTQKLLLTDIKAERLEALLATLSDEGYEAEGVAGDCADPDIARALAERCAVIGTLRTFVNAAGLSPAQADWRAIIRANAIAPVQAIRACEPLLAPDTTFVMIASVAGHLAPLDAEADALLAAPLQPGLLDRLEPRLAALAAADGGTFPGHAYSLSKRAIIRLCEALAPDWGKRHARIVSLSPGMVWTPMGRQEAESGARAGKLLEMTPAGRWGTAMDIAAAVEFLASDAASYISGCDLRVDGGAVAAMRGARF